MKATEMLKDPQTVNISKAKKFDPYVEATQVKL